MAREGKADAGLDERDTAYAEETADFGCLVGGEVTMSDICVAKNNSNKASLNEFCDWLCEREK